MSSKETVNRILSKFFHPVCDAAHTTVMDGGNPQRGWGEFVDLEAHDRQYHHGHYEEGSRCSLRDSIGVTRNNSHLPPREDFDRVINDAITAGILDQESVNQINDMLNEAREHYNRWDDNGDGAAAPSIDELNELYEALRDAFDQRVDNLNAGEQQEVTPPPESTAPADTSAGGETNQNPNQQQRPTQQDIDGAINALVGQYGESYRGQIQDAIDRALQGDITETYLRNARSILGTDHPVIQAIEAARDRRNNAQQEQPNPLPEQNEDTQNDQNGEADASITLPTPVTPPVDYRMPPLNRLRRDQITAEYLGKLSEEVLRAYRYSFRRLTDDWSVSGGLKKVLENPGDYDSLIENLARRGGRFSDRFMKTLEVLHPNYRKESIERQRRAREEVVRRAREAEREAQELAGEVPTSVLSDEQRKQYVEKARRQFPADENDVVSKLDGAMSPEGEPASNYIANFLLCRLTSVHPPTKALVKNLIAACNFAHPEKKILTNEEVNKTRAEIPAQVHAQDMALATEAHVDYLGDRRKAPHGHAGACNCWVNANCQAAQFRGYDMSPIYDGGSRHGEWFENCKLEMSKAYERVSQGTVEDTERWLEENDSRIPDGSHISAWSGGHNVCFHKISGRWYMNDGYSRIFGTLYSLQGMAHCMWNYPDGSDFTTGCHYVSDKERQERIFSLQAQREIRNEARENGTEPDLSPENILRRAKNLFWRSQGSYLIRPDQPLLKVMFRSAEQNPNHYGAET